MISKEEKARIARENGAKSRGPVTPAGKRKVSRNALKHGERAETLADYLPPHYATIANEDRQDYFNLLDELTAVFQPKNKFAEHLVRDIAVARWQILRLEICITNHWNFSLIEQSHQPITVTEELAELQIIYQAAAANQAIIARYNRDIDKLHLRIARLERTLRTAHQHYPEARNVPDQTNPVPPPHAPQPVENTQPDENAPPIFVTENKPGVIAFYKQMFPNHRIVILPKDDVAKGIEIDDYMPDLPRKVA